MSLFELKVMSLERTIAEKDAEIARLRDAFLMASVLQTKLSKAQDIVASIHQLGEVIKEALTPPPKGA